jgi:hypothetical protein
MREELDLLSFYLLPRAETALRQELQRPYHTTAAPCWTRRAPLLP